jgi:FtsZ-interacting cell division protein ZipA
VADLYLIFFLVGAILFLGIVGYSYWQKTRVPDDQKAEYVDPLFNQIAADNDLEQPEQRSGGKDGAPTEKSEAAVRKQSKNISSAETVESQSASESNAAGSNETHKEPSLTKPSSSQQAVPEAPTMREPSLREASSTQSPETGGADSELRKPRTDPKSSNMVTDLVARIKNPDPIEQQGLLGLFRKHDFKFHRKVHIYGLNELTDMWRDIEFELPSARFTELGVSIQLADREGAMSKKELHDFQQMVLEFTNSYDAPFEFSMDLDEALAQASALDKLGRRYDSMAVLNVVPRAKSGFRMADIESCARDLMMATDKNGIFMKTEGHKSNQTVLYRLACTDGTGQFGITMSNAAPVHDLVVYMNVPTTMDPERVFESMVKDANSLATWLDGKVVDRAGKVMTQRSYSTLMQQVSDIAFSMQQDGLIPGDAVSKKLF